MVRTSRINTVSFSYSSVAKNSLVVKPGDLLTVVDGEQNRRVVDLATPDSIIFGICDDKASFPETNETREKERVNYTPVAWDNTYKMDSTGPVKVGYFYTITADGKIDHTSQSPSVGQLMVQDIFDSYIEVRFVSNQGLFVPQYEDTKFQSVRPANPDSDPFDGQYIVTLSDGSEVEMDLSKLAFWLGDVHIAGKLTVDQDTQIAGNTLIEGTLETSGDLTTQDLIAENTTVATLVDLGGATIGGNTSITGNISATGTATITGATSVGSIESGGDAHIGGNTLIDGNITAEGYAIIGTTATIGGATNIGGNTSITGNLTATGNFKANGTGEIVGNLKSGSLNTGTIVSTGTITATGNISGNNISGVNGTLEGTLNVTNSTEIGGTLTVANNIITEGNLKSVGNLEINHSADIDEDLNVDGELHVGGSAQIDEALHAKKTLSVDGNTTLNGNVLINGNISLGANSRATQFILQSEKNQPNGVAALDLDGKVNPSVLPEGIYPKFYYETSTQGSRTYTLQHEPVSDSSIMVFTDSGTALFPTIDYTCANGQITFTTMGATEYAIIWVVAK